MKIRVIELTQVGGLLYHSLNCRFLLKHLVKTFIVNPQNISTIAHNSVGKFFSSIVFWSTEKFIARKFLLESVKNQYIPAMYFYGRCLADGSGGFVKNQTRAIQMLLPAAILGKIEARYKLAECLYNANNVGMSYWLLKLYKNVASSIAFTNDNEDAKSCVREACAKLVDYYYHLDQVEHLKWMKIGAESGNPHLQGEWGNFIDDDFNKSEYWYLRGARQNDDMCQYKMGLIHLKKFEYDEAKYWFEKSGAQQKKSWEELQLTAMYQLFECYKNLKKEWLALKWGGKILDEYFHLLSTTTLKYFENTILYLINYTDQCQLSQFEQLDELCMLRDVVSGINMNIDEIPYLTHSTSSKLPQTLSKVPANMLNRGNLAILKTNEYVVIYEEAAPGSNAKVVAKSLCYMQYNPGYKGTYIFMKNTQKVKHFNAHLQHISFIKIPINDTSVHNLDNVIRIYSTDSKQPHLIAKTNFAIKLAMYLDMLSHQRSHIYNHLQQIFFRDLANLILNYINEPTIRADITLIKLPKISNTIDLINPKYLLKSCTINSTILDLGYFPKITSTTK